MKIDHVGQVITNLIKYELCNYIMEYSMILYFSHERLLKILYIVMVYLDSTYELVLFIVNSVYLCFY